MLRGRKPPTEEIEIGSERFNALGPKIQAKILHARKVAEERAQRKEDKDALKTWLQYEELRAIPVKDQTQEERNAFDRLRRRMTKLEEERQGSVAQGMSKEEFWKLNRAAASKTKIHELLEAQESVLDVENWMERGWAADPNDETEFVELGEGLANIEAFVAEHGLIHDEPLACQHPVLRDSLWESFDAFHKNAETFNLLCQESPASDAFFRFGIRVALSAYNVRTFKQRIAEHQRGKLQADVRRAHLEFESGRCWLCRAWESQQAREAEGQPPQALVEPPPTIA